MKPNRNDHEEEGAAQERRGALGSHGLLLEEKAREMDDFVQALSHDLKEPLRVIDAFSGFLLEDYGSQLDERGQHYLSVLRQTAVRMKDLIHDLLMLASLCQTPPAFQWVDLNEVLAGVLQDMGQSIRERESEILIPSPLPRAFCDPSRIREVLRNLLSNAIKFNTSCPPRVEIRAGEKDDFQIFWVEDNGIGIDPAYRERIFDLFERLHPQEEFEGTGAGLAICKKVISGHAGSIWVESQSGRGSTFFFSLPKQKQAPQPVGGEAGG